MLALAFVITDQKSTDGDHPGSLDHSNIFSGPNKDMDVEERQAGVISPLVGVSGNNTAKCLKSKVDLRTGLQNGQLATRMSGPREEGLETRSLSKAVYMSLEPI